MPDTQRDDGSGDDIVELQDGVIHQNPYGEQFFLLTKLGLQEKSLYLLRQCLTLNHTKILLKS